MERITYNGFFTLQWHITHRCNLRCKHCYQDDYSAFESRDALGDILNQYEALLKEYSYKGHINFTGGEPFTHPDLFWLLEETKKRGITTAVLTNGTLIGKSEAKKLKGLGVDYVQISLDGTKDMHDIIRGNGSFDRAVGGLRELIAQGIYTDVSFTAQSGNLNELKKLARFCDELGVDKLWFDRVVIPASEDKNENKDIYSCTAGDRLLAILADGSVMPCRRLPVAVGNVKENDLLSIYRDSPELIKMRNTAIPEQCEQCEFSEQCRGGARCITYAKTGRYDLPDPDCVLQK